MNKTLKKHLVLFGILLTVALAGMGFTAFMGGFEKEDYKEDTYRIVTSFYPVYIATLNLTDGLTDVEVTNMTENIGGCLHDYQLTAADMKKLENADVFVINGAGMEMFMDSIQKAYPDLQIIDSSEGIPLLEAIEHTHDTEMSGEGHMEEDHIHDEEENHEDHNHGESNGHIWMNPDYYMIQLENIKKGLSRLDAEHESVYESNAKSYIKKVEEVLEELDAVRKDKEREPVVIFHDSYAYLADKLQFDIVYEVVLEEDTSLSAGEVAEIMEEVRLHQVSVLLAEKQFSEQLPTRIAEETGARVVILDSLVSGMLDKNAYLDGMRENIRILKEELN